MYTTESSVRGIAGNILIPVERITQTIDLDGGRWGQTHASGAVQCDGLVQSLGFSHSYASAGPQAIACHQPNPVLTPGRCHRGGGPGGIGWG